MSRSQTTGQSPNQRVASALNAAHLMLQYVSNDIKAAALDEGANSTLRNHSKNLTFGLEQIGLLISTMEVGLADKAGLDLAKSTNWAEQNQSMVNPANTFATLVVGDANKMAVMAAKSIVAASAQSPNLLFVTGDIGMGKTHLLQAIFNELDAFVPDAKMLYLDAEQFVHDVVIAYRQGNQFELQARFSALDVLLFDNINRLSDKCRSQEELLQIIDQLLAKNSRIVFVGSQAPRALTGFDESLVSRFDAGLVVNLDLPSLDMRTDIVKAKAIAAGINPPDEVAALLANTYPEDVRSLEGALHKVVARGLAQKDVFTLEMAQKAIHPMSETSAQSASQS
jgi:chromosomal replication initiator protein